MEKEARLRLERLTQKARRLLEQEFREQLEGRYDILLDGRIPLAPGAHLSPRERVLWDKLVAAVAHKRSQGITSAAAVTAYLREAAFHTLNRFVALKMLEARKLVQECISRGEDSAGFKEFIALAPGLVALPDKGYRLYVETIFDEIAQEVRALFDRRDAATLLWPRRQSLLDLLAALNDPEVASVWGEDETIGWVYQYFNGKDEREEMRDPKRGGSQSPRNSYELAVRNQFFTPRYVVQFLTDNSLGRTWCEMRGGDTQLAHLDYLVKPEEGFEDRVPKDPRDLRVLDPACGSGHFLLYAFDLLAGDPTRSFFGIYEEAWRAEGGPKSQATGRTLKEDYDSELALRRAVPELILKHNLHGVDIDPRAAQIAGLALWMRAQRTYHDHKISAQDRPLIARTNIVTAEPMPGDRSMVAEFASTLRPQVLAELFQRMVEEMRLAGELGSLLKIDRALQIAVAKAREQFVREQREPQKSLPGIDPPRKQQLEFDLSGISDESFFDSAEERIVEALQEYAASAPPSMSVRRQLFSDDAAQGIAFIDLCRKRFDVVLMNPPFGAATDRITGEVEQSYPSWNKNLLCAFVLAGCDRLGAGGTLGAVLDETALVKSTYEAFRAEILQSHKGVMATDLGWGVLDASVEVATLSIGPAPHGVRLTSLGRTPLGDKPHALRKSCKSTLLDPVSVETISKFPNQALPFSLEHEFLQIFEECKTLEQVFSAGAVQGHSMKSERFFRAFWEVALDRAMNDQSAYAVLYNGGGHSYYCSPLREVCRYRGSAGAVADPESVLRNLVLQGKPGVAWGKRGDHVDTHTLPSGAVFTVEGQGFPLEVPTSRWLVLGFLNSRIFSFFVNTYCGQHKYSGYVNVVPFPHLAEQQRCAIVESARQCWAGVAEQWSFDETSTWFSGLGLDLDMDLHVWVESKVRETDARCARTVDGRSKIEAILSKAYGLTSRSVARVAEWAVSEPDLSGSGPWAAGNSASTWAVRVLSLGLGVLFRRWNLSALTSRTFPPDPDTAFEPHRAVFAHLETRDDGLILVDDPGHAKDVEAEMLSRHSRLRLMLESSAQILEFSDLRSWLRGAWFDTHTRMYSEGRRGGPVYWQLATASGSYSVWLYIHRATGDTLFRVLNDFVGPKFDHEKAKLDGLNQEAGANPSAAQRREIELQETFVGELQALKTEVARVAPLWKPNLDDGVILNFAPLWRLVPQSRSWQGECKKAWDKLVAGDYDWAHLAMHLWPERVVPKCIDDRSLAIAHGLEDVFWHEDDSGTWRKRRVDDATVQKLIHERTSASVKAALTDLLSAATPTAGKGRKAKGRSASPRTSATKPAPATARATTPNTALDEATLRAVKAAIASVANGASKADVLAATELSDDDWSKAIAALLDRGDVTRTGQKRGTRYHSGGS